MERIETFFRGIGFDVAEGPRTEEINQQF